jgi:hypothetical protein
MTVQKGARVPLWVVNLLDVESDEETSLVPTEVLPETKTKHLPQVVDKGTLSPEKDDDDQEEGDEHGEKIPLDGLEGAGAEDAPKEVPKDSSLLVSGDEDRVRVLETIGPTSHLIEAKDRFSKLGIPLISRRLAFQGPDIDPYLRYAIQVDVASMVKELGELLGLEPSETETSSQAA